MHDRGGRCEKHTGMEDQPQGPLGAETLGWRGRYWHLTVRWCPLSQTPPLPSLSLGLLSCLPWWSALLHFCHLQMVLKQSGNIVSGPIELLTTKFFLCGINIPFRKTSEERTKQNVSFCQLKYWIWNVDQLFVILLQNKSDSLLKVMFVWYVLNACSTSKLHTLHY